MSRQNHGIITLCSSVSFYRKVVQVADELEGLGYEALIPKTAEEMKKNGNFETKGGKPWIENPLMIDKKTALMNAHFKKVVIANAVLIVNLDKNGITGYIGGNVLMEMTLAYYLKKKIYLWRKVDNKHPFYEEIMGMKVQFIEEDLTKIPARI